MIPTTQRLMIHHRKKSKGYGNNFFQIVVPRYTLQAKQSGGPPSLVMAFAESQSHEESAAPIQSPLLSIIVPVYNGSKKIESTLEQIKTQVEKLQPTVAKLDFKAE